MTRSSVHLVDGWPTRSARVLAAARWKPVGCAFKTGGRGGSAQTFPPGWACAARRWIHAWLQADLVLPLCTKVAPHAKVVAEVPAAAKGAVGRVVRGRQERQANAALHEPGRLPVCKTVAGHGHHAQLGVVAARRRCGRGGQSLRYTSRCVRMRPCHHEYCRGTRKPTVRVRVAGPRWSVYPAST